MTPKLEVAMLLQAFHGLMLEALGTIALHDEQAAKTLGTKYREALAEQPAQPQPVRQPLTDEQIAEACGWQAEMGCKPLPRELRIARAIEAAHGITKDAQ